MDAFNEFDQNHDGYVDFDEATSFMVSRGVSPDKAEELFRKADTNSDARLDYTEFAIFWDIPLK